MIQNIKKYALQTLIGMSLVILTLYALIFSLERIISADTADYMIKLVNEQQFYTGSYRFIAYFTQFLPLFLVKLKAPFNLILQSYSMNLMLFHVTIIATILFYFKDIKTAIIALLSLLLTSTYLFYYPVTELQMGLTLSYLLYSYLNQFSITKKIDVVRFIFVLLIAITVIYSHPLAISFLGFVLFYMLLGKRINLKIFLAWSLVSILIFISKYLFFEVTNDSSNIEFITNIDLFPTEAFIRFWGIAVSKLYLFLAVFLIAIIALIKKRKWAQLAFFICYFYVSFYFSLSKWGSSINWYSIHLCLPFFYIAIFVFGQEVVNPKNVKSVLFFMLPLTIISLIQIPDNKKFNQERIAILDGYINTAFSNDITKGYISPADKGNSSNNWFWAIEYESLILSKYKYDRTATVIYKSPDQISNINNQQTLFLTVWGGLPISYFNPTYFKFEETEYQPVILP